MNRREQTTGFGYLDCRYRWVSAQNNEKPSFICGHHVKNKQHEDPIMTAVRGKIDEGLPGEMEMQKLRHQREHQLNRMALQRALFSEAIGALWLADLLY